MESSSPLSLFEAVFKVIEDRLPFGRQLVTIASVLMLAVIIVYCLGYLIAALAVPANWIALSIRTRSLASLPPLSSSGNWVIWLLLAGSVLYAASITLRYWQLNKAIGKVTARILSGSAGLRTATAELNKAVAAAKRAKFDQDTPPGSSEEK